MYRQNPTKGILSHIQSVTEYMQCAYCSVLDVASVTPLQRAVPVTPSGWRTPFAVSLTTAKATAVPESLFIYTG